MPPRALSRASVVGTTGLVALGPLVLVASVPLPADTARVEGLRVTLPVPSEMGSPVLHPGADLPLDLRVTNPYAVPVEVVALDVRVGTLRPRGGDGCAASDFTATAASFPRLGLPARGASTLSAAGIPSAQWPRVAMTQAASGKDACRRLDVTLHFAATGRLP